MISGVDSLCQLANSQSSTPKKNSYAFETGDNILKIFIPPDLIGAVSFCNFSKRLISVAISDGPIGNNSRNLFSLRTF